MCTSDIKWTVRVIFRLQFFRLGMHFKVVSNMLGWLRWTISPLHTLLVDAGLFIWALGTTTFRRQWLTLLKTVLVHSLRSVELRQEIFHTAFISMLKAFSCNYRANGILWIVFPLWLQCMAIRIWFMLRTSRSWCLLVRVNAVISIAECLGLNFVPELHWVWVLLDTMWELEII